MICLLFVATSCLDEHDVDVTTTHKDEVKFSAQLKRGTMTRTLYGDDDLETIKVKWVDGDKVMVFGTTCVPENASENQVAEYAIQLSGTNTPNNDNWEKDGDKDLSFADDLAKTSERAVRWGNVASEFVAVYPSDGAAFEYDSGTGVVTASTSISATQNYVFADNAVDLKKADGTIVYLTDNNGNVIKDSETNQPIIKQVWKGSHFASDATNPSMQNAIMYARTNEIQVGGLVSLDFEPFSTVLRFRFEGFESLWHTNAEAYIQSITLKAPVGYNIAGNFNISIPTNAAVKAGTPVTATATGNNTNTITINTIKQNGSYLKVAANQAVEFNVFTLPLDNMEIKGNANTPVEELWTVTIQVEGVDPLTYKLLPVEDAEGNTKTYTLVPGLIHKVKVPKMISNEAPEWNPENWITQIPPPVYISELSMPGAWYCTNSAYQNHTSLSDLYAAGIRAFHIDCRVTKNAGSYTWWSQFNSTDPAYLAVAGTESSSTGLGTISLGQGDSVLSLVKQIVGLAKLHPDEYVVIVLTIADQPKNDSDQTIMGSVAPSVVMPYISNILNNTETISYTYNGVAKETSISASVCTNITANTTIEDVLGERNVIVKINSNTDDITNLASVPNTLISFASMASDTNYNTSTDEITDLSADYFAKINTADLYFGKNDASLTYYYHQAQRTTSGVGTSYSDTYQINGIPTLQMRIDAIDDIIAKSSEIYKNTQHDSWFQVGIGGFVKDRDGIGASEDHESVSSTLNDHLYDRIVEKMDSDPSPVGLVLMNHATTTITENGVSKIIGNDLVNAIIEMNGKFYLKRRGNDISTGGDNSNGANQSAVTKSCGNATIGFDAF